MGFIADFAKQAATFTGADRAGKDTWQSIFGSTDKESAADRRNVRGDGGSWTRSIVGNPEAYKRLLTAMRSMAPGGWSDDRWEQSKHFVGIMYLAGHRKYEQLSQAEFAVYEKDTSSPEGKKPVTEGHPGYKLVELLENPNNADGFGDVLYRCGQQMDLSGKCLTWMVPNVFGVPYEIYSMPTAICIPQPAINPDFPDGYYRIQPIYPYGPFSSYPTPSTAVGAPIPAQWIIDCKFPHPLLRYDGYAPLTGLRFHLDEVESIDRSRWYKMKRSTRPSAVLQSKESENVVPLAEAELKRIHAEWENEQEGPENAGRMIICPPGTELSEWGMSPVDMDYPNGWEQLVSFCMAGLGITKAAAGMIDDTSYASLFATLKQLHLLTLTPLCNRLARIFTKRLCPFFGKNLFIEIRCPRIDDHDINNQVVGTMIQGSLGTVNEARTKLGLPPTDEPWGKERLGEAQKQQGGPGGTLPGLSEPGGEGQTTGQPPEKETAEAPESVADSMPAPEEGLSLGSLGPRKAMKIAIRGARLLNGNGSRGV